MKGKNIKINQSHHSARRLHVGDLHVDSNIHFVWCNKVS